MSLDTGQLSQNQVNLLLKSLPVDITLIEDDDRVAYYSATKERIFPRSPGIIGRKVRNYHPPKSLHVVQRILDDFREGKRDEAEFWIQTGGAFIHIRYFAARDEQNLYKGCGEVTQNVTGIRSLKEEKRLLDG